MKTRLKSLLHITAALALAGAAAPASAALQDHGPGDPVVTFPTWYRDLNGVALQQCRSTTQSPNPAGALAPMCFALAADPAGFAGNIGGELFYADAAAAVTGPAFNAHYVAALEAAYLSPTGAPVRGTEVTFARIRVVMDVSVPGTYKVTHPYGVEIFPDVTPGPRAVFFTDDVLPVPGNFDAALAGRLGPWLQWDQLLPGETLTTTNAAGQTEQFIGDPNFPHTFTGSPFATNYFRVDGPPGSNLDGAGNDFIQTPLASILGQKYLLPIPTPLLIQRASYSRDPVKNLNSVDVFAKSAPAARLIVTGAALPSVTMKTDGQGNFWAHVEYPATVALPAGISVTNLTDFPPTTVTTGLSDVVTIASATFDTLTSALNVTASSSDLSVPPPALAVAGPLGGPMTAGAFSKAVLAPALPPTTVTVISAAAGTATTELIILPGLPMNPLSPPVAVPDTFTVNQNVASTVSVSANDAVVAPATLASAIVTQVPAHGTAVAAATPGSITYTPAAGFSGADSFQYVIQDSTGAISNVATVNVTVAFSATPPVAVGDNWAQTKGTARTVNVLANDKPAPGTTLDPASITIVGLPANGTAVPNADGTITYTPAPTFAGSVTFTYTVKNNFGQASSPASVFVFVSTTAEALTPRRVDYITSKKAWTIVGNTSVFGPQLTPSVTCWIGRTAGAGAVLGTAPIDATGAFTLVPVAGTVPAPDATRAVACQTTNGGIGVFGVTVK
jgi:hypothetical protein